MLRILDAFLRFDASITDINALASRAITEVRQDMDFSDFAILLTVSSVAIFAYQRLRQAARDIDELLSED